MEKFEPSLRERLSQTPSPKPKFKLPNGRVNAGRRYGKMQRPRYYHIILNKAWYRQQLP